MIIAGHVDQIATITPPSVSLRGFVGDSLKTSVTIVPEEKYAFKITKARAQSGKFIKLELEEIKGVERTEYALTVENIRQEAGRFADVIILETDSKVKPSLSLRVYGYLQSRPAEGQE